MSYHGVKFKTYRTHSFIEYPESINELIYWCNNYALLGLAPIHSEGSYGNLSIRFKDGLIISRTSLDLSKYLHNEDFVFVEDCDYSNFSIQYSGNYYPSSETPVHWRLYEMRSDVNAIFHGHSNILLSESKRLNIPQTLNEQEYGSPELVNEVSLMSIYNFFNMKNHGFISMGKSMEEAGSLSINYLKQAQNFD